METTIITHIGKEEKNSLLSHVSIEYRDREAQACNFVETEWRGKSVLISTLIFLN